MVAQGMAGKAAKFAKDYVADNPNMAYDLKDMVKTLTPGGELLFVCYLAD